MSVHALPELLTKAQHLDIRSGPGLAAVRAFIRSATCALGGHDYLLHGSHNRLCLRCVGCGRETPGWQIDVQIRSQTRSIHSEATTMARTHAATSPRTDAEIFAQARKALDEHPSIPATVRVHIDDGAAWLTGIVRLNSQRAEAEKAVRQVPGVRHVVNKLTVAQAMPSDFEPPDSTS